MRLKGGLLATTALAVVLWLTVSGCQSPPSADARIEQLGTVILEQKRKSELQESRLAEQERRQAELEKELVEQELLIAEQSERLARQQRLTDAQGVVLTYQNEDLHNLRSLLDLGSRSSGGAWYRDPLAGVQPAEDVGVVRSAALDGEVQTALMRGLTEPAEADLAQGVTPVPPVPVPPGEERPQEGPALEPQAPAIQPRAPESQPEQREDVPGAERPESVKPQDQLLIEAGGILLPQGTVQIEPSVEYSHFSSDRLTVNGLSVFDAVIIGFIRADDIDRDVVTSALTGRVGVFRRIQADLRIPAVWREDTETLGVGTSGEDDRITENFNIGDIEAGLSYQPVLASGFIPDVILRLSGTFPTGEHPFEIDLEPIGPGGETRLEEPPTGSGFYSAKGTSTLVWVSDPVVFFAGGGYTWTFERDFNRFGEIDPGNVVEFFAGLNVALSDRISLNLSFVDQIVGSTEQEGDKVQNSRFNDGRVLLGTSIGLTPETSLLVSAGIGLTDESPDFTFQMSLPFTFQDLF